MIYKAVIFDLDGVLCHTDKYHYKAWLQIADELGIYFDEEINNLLRGVGRMQSLDIILSKANKELSKKQKIIIADEKNNIYKELIKQMSFDDVDEDVLLTLNEIRRQKIKMAIGSSSKNAKQILSNIGLMGYFDVISDGTNISKSKPDPEVFLYASKLLGIPESDCIVVEDAVSGVVAAKSANMDCAAIGDAAASPLATFALNKVSDLLKYV